MRKILVFQHVANKILGTLNPLLKARGHRIAYVNYERNPDSRPSVDKYNGLIVLGGHMGVYERSQYTHIDVELETIQKAIEKGIPVLGICLGAQLLAHALGAKVRKCKTPEIGWQKIRTLPNAKKDPLFQHFQSSEIIFQMHGDTFEIPENSVHLAESDICPAQAFRYKDKFYGLQFHLESDRAMIERWQQNPHQLPQMTAEHRERLFLKIQTETAQYIERSTELSQKVFNSFLDLIGRIEKVELLGTDHGKPSRG